MPPRISTSQRMVVHPGCLVYAFFLFTISEPNEARYHDLWVGKLDRWPSCYSANSFGDANIQFVIKTKIFYKQYRSKHWWISLTLAILGSFAVLLQSNDIIFIFLSNFLKKSWNLHCLKKCNSVSRKYCNS
jgi:hypothetical protein